MTARQKTSKIASSSRFAPVNTVRYQRRKGCRMPRYALREIMLAMEAMTVPRPPILTPRSNGFGSCTYGASITVVGTLLRNWLNTSDIRNTWPVSISSAHCDSSSILVKLFTVRKRNTKSNSSL